MKFANLILFFLALILTSCFGYRELPVEYDYSYKGKFTKYKTYNLFDLPIVDGDSSMSNSVIERTIDWRMRVLGYQRTKKKPHLLISYRMFFDSLKFKGYNQPDIENWALNQTTEKEIYNKEDFSFKDGTLVIQLYDRRQRKSIWQGYATNQYGSIKFNNDRNIRNAVVSILDKYRFVAEGFLNKKVLVNGQNITDAEVPINEPD